MPARLNHDFVLLFFGVLAVLLSFIYWKIDVCVARLCFVFGGQPSPEIFKPIGDGADES